MKNTQNLTIDINKKPFQTITANVGEVASRFIRITILENNIPADLTGVTAYLYAKKADGTKVFNSVKVENAKQGIVLAELTSQVLAAAGLVRLTLLLTKDGAKLASKQIVVAVDESAIDEDAIQSTNEFNALTEALKKVNNVDSKASKTELEVERKRIDSLTRLEEGSTTGDAELIDGRVGVDGYIYSNIGSAIREQIKSNINQFVALPFELTPNMYISIAGKEVSHTSSGIFASNYIKLLPGDTLYIDNLDYLKKDSAGLAFYDSGKNFISSYQYDNDNDLVLNIPSMAEYVRFTYSSKNSTGKLVIYQDNIESLNNLYNECGGPVLQGENIELEIGFNNKYVDSTGRIVELENWLISRPVFVKAGTTITAYAKGYLTSVSVICRYISDTEYIPLVTSKGNSYNYYTYTTEEDIYVSIVSASNLWKMWTVKDIYNTKDISKEIENAKVDYNGKTYSTLHEAITVPISKINKDMSILKYTSTFIENAYVQWNTGNVVQGTTPHLYASDYISVMPGMEIQVLGIDYKPSDLAGLAFYDSNKKYIEGYAYGSCVDFIASVPKGASYVCLTARDETIDTMKITTSIQSITDSIIESNKTIKDSTEFVTQYEVEVELGYYVLYSTGKVATYSGNYSVTNLIELPSIHTSITINDLNWRTNDLAGCAFYDKNENFISGVQFTSGMVSPTFSIPQGAKYFRATTRWSDTTFISNTSVKDKLTDVNNSLIQAQEKLEDEAKVDPFNYCQIFHKIAGIGDSLMSGEIAIWNEELQKNNYYDCYNYSWLSNLCKNIGAEAVHYSSGGQTTKSWLNKYLSVMQSEEIKPSAYFIGLGTNDTNYVELGTEDDCGTDNETFYGMYSKIIKEVQAFNPNASIFCLSLYYSPTSEKVISYCNAIKFMAEKYGCFYVDFLNNYPEYSTNATIKKKYVAGGHFTTHGYVRVGQQILELTNDVIRNNSDEFKFMSKHYMDLK